MVHLVSRSQAIIWSFFLIGPDTMHLVAYVAGIKKRGGGRKKCKRETPIPNPPPSFPFSHSLPLLSPAMQAMRAMRLVQFCSDWLKIRFNTPWYCMSFEQSLIET